LGTKQEKQEAEVIQLKKNQEQAAQDKKNQAVAKVKKSQPQTAQPKKRRFTFFNDVIGELRKVVWPTRQETLRLTLIVLGLCILMGVVLGAIDYGFSELVAKVFLGGK
jgi:preprotein translocase subunit SecE